MFFVCQVASLLDLQRLRLQAVGRRVVRSHLLRMVCVPHALLAVLLALSPCLLNASRRRNDAVVSRFAVVSSRRGLLRQAHRRLDHGVGLLLAPRVHLDLLTPPVIFVFLLFWSRFSALNREQVGDRHALRGVLAGDAASRAALLLLLERLLQLLRGQVVVGFQLGYGSLRVRLPRKVDLVGCLARSRACTGRLDRGGLLAQLDRVLQVVVPDVTLALAFHHFCRLSRLLHQKELAAWLSLSEEEVDWRVLAYLRGGALVALLAGQA